MRCNTRSFSDKQTDVRQTQHKFRTPTCLKLVDTFRVGRNPLIHLLGLRQRQHVFTRPQVHEVLVKERARAAAKDNRAIVFEHNMRLKPVDRGIEYVIGVNLVEFFA